MHGWSLVNPSHASLSHHSIRTHVPIFLLLAMDERTRRLAAALPEKTERIIFLHDFTSPDKTEDFVTIVDRVQSKASCILIIDH
jgi:hypothetical protein